MSRHKARWCNFSRWPCQEVSSKGSSTDSSCTKMILFGAIVSSSITGPLYSKLAISMASAEHSRCSKCKLAKVSLSSRILFFELQKNSLHLRDIFDMVYPLPRISRRYAAAFAGPVDQHVRDFHQAPLIQAARGYMKLGKSKTELGALGANRAASGLKWLESCRTETFFAMGGECLVMSVMG